MCENFATINRCLSAHHLSSLVFSIEKLMNRPLEHVGEKNSQLFLLCWFLLKTVTYLIPYWLQNKSDSKQTEDSLTKVQCNALTSVLTYAPSSIKTRYWRSTAVYKTSYGRLFSLIAGSVVWVSPYASFTLFPKTATGHYGAFFGLHFFWRAKMYNRSLACLRDCSPCFTIIFGVNFQSFSLFSQCPLKR